MLCFVFCRVLWVVPGSTPAAQVILNNSAVHVLWFQGYIYLEKKIEILIQAFYVYLNTPNEVKFLDNKMMKSGRFGFRFLLVITLQCSCFRLEGEGT